MTYSEKLRRYKRWLEKQIKKVNDALTKEYSKQRGR